MSTDLFTVGGGKVSLSRNPELTELEEVKIALLAQVKDSESGAVLDMTGMDSISSTTIGMAVAVHLRAAEAGRTVTIRIREDQKRLFELTMLTGTLSLDVVATTEG
jgi:anti-anti-sigma regulatory factor